MVAVCAGVGNQGLTQSVRRVATQGIGALPNQCPSAAVLKLYQMSRFASLCAQQVGEEEGSSVYTLVGEYW